MERREDKMKKGKNIQPAVFQSCYEACEAILLVARGKEI